MDRCWMMRSAALFSLMIVLLSPIGARATEDLRIIVPTSAWLVGPSTVSAAQTGAARFPCIMATQYDNGYFVRISGGGGRLATMAVDFRQKAFTPRMRYDVTLTIPDAVSLPLKATAFDETILIINLQAQPDLYSALQGGQFLVLRVGETDVPLALAGVREGLQRVEECYDPAPKVQEARTVDAHEMDQATSEPVKIDATVKILAAAPEPADDAPVQILEQAAMQEEPVAEDPAPAPEMLLARKVQPAMPLWKADAGESVKSVLGRWSEKAGVELVWETKNSATLGDNFLYEGAFEDAVPALLVFAGKDAGIQGSFGEKPEDLRAVDSEKLSEEIRGREVVDIIPAAGTDAGQEAGHMPRWRALSGANLREVLEMWSEHEGVALVWDAGKEFAVKESVSAQMTFENALLTLLEQYNGEGVRPVGRLHREPETGMRYLVIQTDSAS